MTEIHGARFALLWRHVGRGGGPQRAAERVGSGTRARGRPDRGW
jgi:hypothetical protein